MRVLMIGDVVGRAGRRAVRALLAPLRADLGLDLIVVNAENAAGGVGLTPDTAHELFDAGADVLTSGNHIWDKREIYPALEGGLPILRPLNYPAGVPGQGAVTRRNVLVVNLMGRTFMNLSLDCPFRTMDKLLAEPHPPVVLVDFHAEATSEKVAMGWYLDGRVSAVVGTHTHVATADARLLPKGTAYVSDIGMTGARDSVIGVEADAVIERFLTGMPNRFITAEHGPVTFNAVLIDLDAESGRSHAIQRLDRELP